LAIYLGIPIREAGGFYIFGAVLQLVCGVPFLFLFRRVQQASLRILIATLAAFLILLPLGVFYPTGFLDALVLFPAPIILGSLYTHANSR